VYKYEQTLHEIDGAIKGGQRVNTNDTILELKRIAEKQLKEIVVLQNEIEIVKYNSNPSATPNCRLNGSGAQDLDN
jgi:hypothetical protein